MKTLCALIVLAFLATPAMISAGEAPAAPTAANLLDAIFADEGGPCIYICAISRVCACDPPVTIQCAGCRSCNQNMFGIVCDGVLTSCPPCAM